MSVNPASAKTPTNFYRRSSSINRPGSGHIVSSQRQQWETTETYEPGMFLDEHSITPTTPMDITSDEELEGSLTSPYLPRTTRASRFHLSTAFANNSTPVRPRSWGTGQPAENSSIFFYYNSSKQFFSVFWMDKSRWSSVIIKWSKRLLIYNRKLSILLRVLQLILGMIEKETSCYTYLISECVHVYII